MRDGLAAAKSDQPAAAAVVRPENMTAAAQRLEGRREELDTPVAILAALAEELARQVRLARSEQLVDPVVDLAEKLSPARRFHAATLHV